MLSGRKGVRAWTWPPALLYSAWVKETVELHLTTTLALWRVSGRNSCFHTSALQNFTFALDKLVRTLQIVISYNKFRSCKTLNSRPTAEAVSGRLWPPRTGFEFNAFRMGLCGGLSSNLTEFSPGASVFLFHLHSTIAPHKLIYLSQTLHHLGKWQRL